MAGTRTSVTVTVNEEPRELQQAATVMALVADLGLGDRNGIAVAINGAVVPRAVWPARVLEQGDRVLLIQATQGG